MMAAGEYEVLASAIWVGGHLYQRGDVVTLTAEQVERIANHPS